MAPAGNLCSTVSTTQDTEPRTNRQSSSAADRSQVSDWNLRGRKQVSRKATRGNTCFPTPRSMVKSESNNHHHNHHHPRSLWNTAQLQQVDASHPRTRKKHTTGTTIFFSFFEVENISIIQILLYLLSWICGGASFAFLRSSVVSTSCAALSFPPSRLYDLDRSVVVGPLGGGLQHPRLDRTLPLLLHLGNGHDLRTVREIEPAREAGRTHARTHASI